MGPVQQTNRQTVRHEVPIVGILPRSTISRRTFVDELRIVVRKSNGRRLRHIVQTGLRTVRHRSAIAVAVVLGRIPGVRSQQTIVVRRNVRPGIARHAPFGRVAGLLRFARRKSQRRPPNEEGREFARRTKRIILRLLGSETNYVEHPGSR